LRFGSGKNRDIDDMSLHIKKSANVMIVKRSAVQWRTEKRTMKLQIKYIMGNKCSVSVNVLEDYRISRNKSNEKSMADHRANVENIADVVFENIGNVDLEQLANIKRKHLKEWK